MPNRNAKKKSSAKKKVATQAERETSPPTLIPPKDGATVRMYRTGHGDCFLIAFPGESDARPVYVLIDCGYKPGSPAYIDTKIKDITTSIREACGGHIDVAVITHEHQDHVNGITEKNFAGISIGEAWFAWTEDPNDDLANQLSSSWTFGVDGATEQIFMQMAAQVQSYFNAAGDSGAYPPGKIPTPNDSTNITIVGGTTLFTTGPAGS